MKQFEFFITLTSCVLIIACSTTQYTVKPKRIVTSSFVKQQPLSDEEKKDWFVKDVYADSIPGISLTKTYDFLKDKKGKTITVAVIDTELDIAQEDLKNKIWINKDEIPNNNIDDDKNGYVDDIHGWNYVGTRKGDSLPYTSFSYVRFIKKYNSKFKESKIDNISKEELSLYEEYLQAVKTYNTIVAQKNKELSFYNRIDSTYDANDKIIHKYFVDGKYSLKQLDSLNVIATDKNLKKALKKMISYLKNGATKTRITKEKEVLLNYVEKLLNKEREDRVLTKDNPNDINDEVYGNNNVQGTYSINHGVKVTGVLIANRNNNIGIKGVIDDVQLMPISIIAYGDPFDKDIALAIRYAVDNGAKVINMSLSNEYSSHREWVYSAIEYAAANDVLIITSAGNESTNIDETPNYPNDSYNLTSEFTSNFIKVGATTYNVDSTLVSDISNYGKNSVDIFAPGEDLLVLRRNGTEFANGTSYSAPIVAGVAALIRSYYPNLSASEVKQIIMESGVSYNIMVNKPSVNKEKKLVPFSSLSKSGKIVNAYNALLMAEEVSKKKKRK